MNGPAGHERAFELLPWLVNGSLAPAERDSVEQHVRTCIVCRRELKQQQQLRSALRAQPAVHVSPLSGFTRLSSDLDAPASPRRAPRAAFAPVLRFAVVGIFGMAFLGALLWFAPSTQREGDTAQYTTLATEGAGAHLDLVFAQSTTAADMQTLLDEIDGSITAGPSDAGRYTVRIADGGATDDELAALLARLTKDPRVRFAARALSVSGP